MVHEHSLTMMADGGFDPSSLSSGNGLLIAGIVFGIIVLLVVVKIIFSIVRKVLSVIIGLALVGAIGGGFAGIATGAFDKVPEFFSTVFDSMPWS